MIVEEGILNFLHAISEHDSKCPKKHNGDQPCNCGADEVRRNFLEPLLQRIKEDELKKKVQ